MNIARSDYIVFVDESGDHDLTARPAGLSVLRPEQPNRAWDVLKGKLFSGHAGCVTGNGMKIFP